MSQKKIQKEKAVKAVQKKDVKKPAAKKPEPKKPEPKESPEYTLKFEREEFQKALAVACDIAGGKVSMPVLSHILISSNGNSRCKLAATDLDITWTRLVKYQGDKFSRCVPANLLFKEVKALPPDVREVSLVFKGDIVTINSRCKIFNMPHEDFPALPEIKEFKEVQVDDFISGLRKVLCAAGDSDTRYTLKGVLLDLEHRKLVATDGHRLHFEDMKVRGANSGQVLIPSPGVTLMIKHKADEAPKLTRQKGSGEMVRLDAPHSYELDVFGLKVKVTYEPNVHKKEFYSAQIQMGNLGGDYPSAGEVKKGVEKYGTLKDYLLALAEAAYLREHKTVFVTVSKNHITYPAAGGELVIRLIDGAYPKYSQVIPKKNPIRVSFNPDIFIQNLEGALPVASTAEKGGSVLLTINGALNIKGESPDRGTFSWRIPCEVKGKGPGNLDMRFNARYLLDALKAYPQNEAVLEINEPLDPCLINGRAVVMPMRA